MNILNELLPLAVFFYFYKTYDLFIGTAAIMICSIGQLALMYISGRKPNKTQITTTAILLAMGGLTLLFNDESFIKYKPSIVYVGFSLVILYFWLLHNTILMQKILVDFFDPPASVWQSLNISWVILFIVLAALNIFIAENYSTDTWVSFKIFGFTSVTMVFLCLQLIILSRYKK